MEGYLYDRWNVIMISQLDPVTGAHLARKWSCLWKPDVASLPYARTSWQKAGGVGGLAWLQTGGTQNMSTTYHSYYGQYVLTGNAEIQVPIMDHMGNVRHYIQLKSGTVNQGYGNIGTMIGQVSANLEYDAFGREVRVSSLTVPPTGTPPGLVAGGLYADALPFHFSTKFTDPESGLNYYGYRFYDARDGRWLNRDPIAESGGVNLYGMVGNNVTSSLDVLGLKYKSTKGACEPGSSCQENLERLNDWALEAADRLQELLSDKFIDEAMSGGPTSSPYYPPGFPARTAYQNHIGNYLNTLYQQQKCIAIIIAQALSGRCGCPSPKFQKLMDDIADFYRTAPTLPDLRQKPLVPSQPEEESGWGPPSFDNLKNNLRNIGESLSRARPYAIFPPLFPSFGGGRSRDY
jgi:RHS repeat-associated protein